MKPTPKTHKLTRKVHADHRVTETERAERFAALTAAVAARSKGHGRPAGGHAPSARFEALQKRAERTHNPRG